MKQLIWRLRTAEKIKFKMRFNKRFPLFKVRMGQYLGYEEIKHTYELYIGRVGVGFIVTIKW